MHRTNYIIITNKKNILNINSTTRVLIFNTEGITDPEFFHRNIHQ